MSRSRRMALMAWIHDEANEHFEWEKYMLRELILGSLIVMCIACVSNDTPLYRPNPADPNVTATNLRVAVTQFEGFSCDDYHCGYSPGTREIVDYFPGPTRLVTVPVILVSGLRDIDHTKTDFAGCLRQELLASNAFSTVDNVAWEDLRTTWRSYDVVITGTTYYDRRWQYTQPLFAVASLLGVPYGLQNRAVSMGIEVAFTESPALPFMTDTLEFTVPTSLKGSYFFYDNPRQRSECPSEDLQPLFLKFRTRLQETVQTEIAKAPRPGKK